VSIHADSAAGPGAGTVGPGADASTVIRGNPVTSAGQANGDTSLRAVDLTLSFGPRAVLSDISLECSRAW
jgi:hypothetical protein